jgi:hypothetical protein
MQRTVLSLAVPIGEPLRRASGLLEQGGQPERRLARSLYSKPVAAARLPWSFAHHCSIGGSCLDNDPVM